MPAAQEAAVDVIRDAMQATTLLHDPFRVRALEQLVEPDSAAGLARRLRVPRQKVNYHLRALEKAGFLKLVKEQRKGNCTERVLRAKARYFVISPAVLGSLSANKFLAQDRFSAGYLVALAARAITEIAILGDRAEKAGKKLPTLSLQTEICFASAKKRSAFTEELTANILRLVAKYHRGGHRGGRCFRFIIGGYPALAGSPAQATEET